MLAVLIAASAFVTNTASALSTDSLVSAAADIDSAATGADYPSIVSFTAGTQGFTIRWSAYEGAVKYRLFMRNGNRWKGIGDTASTSLSHNGLTDGAEYTYTVRALDASGAFLSAYYTKGWTKTFYAPPKLISAVKDDGGVKVSWNKIPTDDCVYRVYKRNGSSWSGIASTTEDYYIDSKVEEGNAYSYTVRAYTPDMREMLTSYDSAGVSVLLIDYPTVTKIESRPNAVRIIWNEVPTAYSYRVFYHNGTKWKIIGDTKGLYYDHAMTSTGVEYTYTVRAMNSAGKFITDYYRDGWTHKHLAAPKLISAANAYGGQKITWEKVDSAEGYRVYYKTDGSWMFMGNSDTESYLAEGLENGVTYTYTVRCVSADGVNLQSYFDRTGVTKQYVEAPVVSSIENLSSGALLTWSEIEGVEKFRVFYHNGTKWKILGDVGSSSYCHSDAEDCTTYKYTVRAIDDKGNFISGYNTDGFINTYYAAPGFSEVNASANSTYLAWDAREGVAAYRVYRRGVTGKWKWLGDTEETEFTDTRFPKNAPYQYTLRCLDADGETVSPFLDNNPYYYNGELADGIIYVDGESYRFLDGKRVKDYVTAQDIIDIAEAEVGYAAEYYKKCKYNTWYYEKEVSGEMYDWCAVFVNWVFNEAGASELLYGKYANCGAMGKCFKDNGALVTSDYQVGDVVFFHWDDSMSTFVPEMKSLDHVGIITAVNEDGSFTTIEGNTGLSRDGEVLYQTRYERQISCAGRPAYGTKLGVGHGEIVEVAASALGAELMNAPAGGERPVR